MAPSDLPTPALSPSAARVFYNALDAWFPPEPGGRPGAGDLDLLPATLAQLSGSTRRLEAVLRVMEWLPRCALGRSGFCRLPRSQRRRWLGRAERLPLPVLGGCLQDLRVAAERAYRSASGVSPGQASSPEA